MSMYACPKSCILQVYVRMQDTPIVERWIANMCKSTRDARILPIYHRQTGR